MIFKKKSIWVLLFISIFLLIYWYIKKSPENVELDGEYKVVSSFSNSFAISHNNKNYYISNNGTYNVDSIVYIKSSSINRIETNSDFDIFLKSNNISYVVNSPKIELVSKGNSIRSIFANYLESGPVHYSKYTALILIGDLNNNAGGIEDKLSEIAALHLFVISGFHLVLLNKILIKFFSIMKIKHEFSNCFSLLILTFYLYLLNAQLSSLRAMIVLVLSYYNKLFFSNKIHKLNLLSISALMIMFNNLFTIMSFSFIFSYIVNYVIYLSNNTKFKRKKLLSSVFAYLSSLGVVIFINGNFSLLGFLNNLILTPIMPIFYILSILFFWAKNMMDKIYIVLDVLINSFHELNINIYISINPVIIKMYYVFIFSFLTWTTDLKIKNKYKKLFNFF